VSTQPKHFLTEEEYLEIERKAEFKSEYFAGEMFAMAGAKEGHNLLGTNFVREISQQLRSRPCRVYSNDMRVRIAPSGLYAYPDVVAVCGEPQFLDDNRDNLLNPALIVEILSPSTEAYDRGDKFEFYRSIESRREYVLVSTSHVHVDLLTRQPDGNWLLRSLSNLSDTLEFESVGARITLSDLYEKVEFTPAPPVMRPQPR